MIIFPDAKEKPSEEKGKEEGAKSGPTKRPREESGRGHPDPTQAPDPEEPEKFDENEFQSSVYSGFTLPQDKNTITLDPRE